MDSTGARLVDRRGGFYWCKVSGQEARILLVQLVDRRHELYWCKVSGQEERILLVKGKWTGGEDSTGAR